MKLIYIANTRIPTEKSHGMAIMKLCESFALAGVDVELVLPRRNNSAFAGVDPFVHYRVKKIFSITHLPCPDFISLRAPMPVAFILGFIHYFLFARVLKKYLINQPDAILFSREQRLLYFLRKLANFKVYEIHDFPKKTFFYKKLLNMVDLIVVTNIWKKNELSSMFKLPVEKIAAVPNAVDVDIFSGEAVSVARAREQLGVSQNKKLVVYVGGFQQWKGVYVLAKALMHLPKDIEIHMVGGGAEPERSQFLEYLKIKDKEGMVVIHEAVPHPHVPLWLHAADVLVAPGSDIDPRGAFYTSPLKIFEYVASGRPLVLTDLLSVREALQAACNKESFDGLEHLLVPSNNPKALAEALIKRLAAQHEWVPLVDKKKMFEWLSWEHRARKIISHFLKKN